VSAYEEETMIDFIEIVGLMLCAAGVSAYAFYQIQLGKDPRNK
tara:strand:+ start:735 stop:863 length:129 start_codon:yes stop_codon:yes gene_type:complete